MANLNISKGKSPQNLIINELTLVAPDRNRKDAAKLKAAIQRAESIHNPNRAQLYDLYNDIVSIDGHLSGLIQKRIDAVRNKSIRFIDPEGKKIDSLAPLIESEKFGRFIELIMESILWGVSGVQFIVGKNFDFVEIPRKHIRPESGIIARSQFDFTGIDYTTDPFIHIIGKPYNLGKLLQCSLYALYKRSGFGDFAQYVEIFGQPVRIIYYDAYDTQTKSELRKILDQAGGSLAMMVPKQAKFEMLDGKTANGTGELQSRLIQACNDEMSLAILGNTETSRSSQSSGYAQSKTHADQQLEITKSDIKFVANVLNNPSFLNILAAYGFPVNGKFEFEKELDIDKLKLRLDIDQIVSANVTVSSDYWYQTYGIPKPDKPTQLSKKSSAPASLASPPTSNELSSDNDIVLHKSGKNPLKRIADFFFEDAQHISLNHYYKACECSLSHAEAHGRGLHDLIAMDNADDIYSEIATALLSEQLQNGVIPERLYFETAKQLTKAISDGLYGSVFNYDDTRNILKSYLTRNIYHFSAAKSLTELLEFRNLMYDKATGEIRSFSDFRNAITEKGKLFNEVYLQTEYDTALQSAIMAHKWDSLQSEYLEFSTVGDDRVRPEHAALDGLTYPKNHPIWNRMYPPLAWNCRCTVVPGIAANYATKDEVLVQKQVAKLVKGTIFDNNVGKTRLIFTDGHPYFNSINTPLTWKNYGLRPIKKMLQNERLKPMAQLNSIEEYNAWWNANINHAHGVVINDPLGQAVLFDDYNLTGTGKKKSGFRQHLENRTDDPERYQLIANLKDVITNPDEIWSVMKRGDKVPLTNHYIKYYNGNPILVNVSENKASTMFILKESGYKTREGVLLYRKTK